MSQSPSTGLVLIHGAGLGSWIWDEVAAGMQAPVLGVEFPHRGEPKETRSDLSLGDYVRHVAQETAAGDVERIVIVAHSIGGVVGLEVAKRLGERLVGFVAVSASIPEPGGSFVSVLPFPQRYIMPLMMRFAGTKPPESAIRSGMCNGLDEEQTNRVVSSFSAESRRLYTDPTSTDPFPTVPCIYVRTMEDRELSPDLQAVMASRLPSASTVAIPSGHLPMLSHPAELAGTLNDFLGVVRVFGEARGS